jgi:hypothetical protein
MPEIQSYILLGEKPQKVVLLNKIKKPGNLAGNLTLDLVIYGV